MAFKLALAVLLVCLMILGSAARDRNRRDDPPKLQLRDEAPLWLDDDGLCGSRTNCLYLDGKKGSAVGCCYDSCDEHDEHLNRYDSKCSSGKKCCGFSNFGK